MTSPWQMKATSGAGTEVPPAGSHGAKCVALVDLGTHREEFKDQKTGKVKEMETRKVYIAWELTSCPLSGTTGLNHVVGRDYNLSFGPKSALRQLVEKWRGKALADGEDFDLNKLLGASCLLTITHGTSAKGNTFGKIDGVVPPPKGMAIANAKVIPFVYSIDMGEYGPPVWMPDYLYGEKISDIIASCLERRGPSGHQAATPPAATPPQQEFAHAGAAVGDGPDELPF